MKIQIFNKYAGLLFALAMFSLISCGDLEQNLVINPDGSGTLETSMELGEMMTMMKGMGDMGDMMNEDVTISMDTEIELKEIDSTTIVEEMEPEPPKDPMQVIMDRVTNPDYHQNFDTLIAISSIMPDSVKAKQTRPDLLEKVNLRIQSPASSSSLTMGIVMNFDDQVQLREIINEVSAMNGESSSGMLSGAGPGGGLNPESYLVFDADMKAGWIRFDSIDYSGFANNMGMAGDSSEQSENLAMLEMMFGNSKIKSIIHVPGDVTSCTNDEAILTKDNKVIVEYGFMDVIKKGKVPGYTIYFTPKKG